MYTQTKDVNLSLYTVSYPDQSNLPLFINNRGVDGATYSIEYPVQANLFISINTLNNSNVNGTLSVFKSLITTSDFQTAPDYTISVINSVIQGSIGGIYTLSFILTAINQRFLGFQFVPSNRNSFSGCLSIHSNILYSFTPTLPPEGFIVKEVDSISGVEIPLMSFFP